MSSILENRRIWIKAMGCRTNQYEADALASMLEERGAVITEEHPCDVAILITCTVTAVADRKCRQMLRRLRRQSPGALIIAAGCWSQKISAEEAASLDIDLLLGTRQKAEIPSLLEDALKRGGFPVPVMRTEVLRNGTWDPLYLHRPVFHTRAFVKVQDGCDHFCSYCIIPYVRGKPVSRKLDDVDKEVREIIASGCSEVVLTGVHLGLFGRDIGSSLGELVQRVASVDGVRRIRFGSLEPFSIDTDLLKVLRDTSVFCPHLHLPLQSGDDGVLGRMRRGHTAAEFLDVAERVREVLGDDVHISSDILVGFPGEDERAFENTLSVIRKAGLGRIHVFPYSPREGTPAAHFDGAIDRFEAEERCRQTIALGERQLADYARNWKGKSLSVLVEKTEKDTFSGLSPHFLRVTSEGSAEVGSECMVRIEGTDGGTLIGRLEDESGISS